MNLSAYKVLTILFSIILISCGRSETGEKTDLKKDPVKFRKVEPGECIKHIIYKRHGSDISLYDSIQTLYFHELLEYTDDDALFMSKEVDSIKRLMYNHNKWSPEMEEVCIQRIDSLQAELSAYKKYVSGYAFVHTFYDGKDTISAIFVMDTLCGFGEMTVVKDLKEDPILMNEYSEKIKQGKK
jgi:hypothetical protein